MREPRWLDWAQRLQATAQNGLHYCREPFDRLRYAEVQQVAAEIMAAGTGESIETIRARFEREEGHATPKVDVRAGVLANGRILLVREKEDGRWSLPGGWADVSDSPSRAAEREVWEEAGVRVRAAKLVALLDRHAQHPPSPYATWRAFFLCDMVTEEGFRANAETDEVAYFPLDAIPPLSTNRTTSQQIGLLFEHQANPTLPTVFD